MAGVQTMCFYQLLPMLLSWSWGFYTVVACESVASSRHALAFTAASQQQLGKPGPLPAAPLSSLLPLSASRLRSSSACALLRNSFPTLVPSSFSSPLSSHMRLLQLLLPQSAGPQLLLLSELGSFLVRYFFSSISCLSVGAPL